MRKLKKKPRNLSISGPFAGGDKRDRTADLLNAIQIQGVAIPQIWCYTSESNQKELEKIVVLLPLLLPKILFLERNFCSIRNRSAHLLLRLD